MDLVILILSEVRQTEKDKYIVYMWKLKKNDTNELLYKIEIYPKTQKTNLPKGKGGAEG